MQDPGTSALLAYTQAWSAPDLDLAHRLIASCMAEDCEIIGPGYCFVGLPAVLAEIERFHTQQPGAKAVVTSPIDRHGRWARFTIALRAADGRVVHEGWDIVELDAQDKVRRVITFWGALPSTPL